ncbi:MAG: hypothetical protein IKC94_04400 [Lentisphaeria bacterium]|nr:hypothetical protein [Lentisphaeria bacterium]
MNPGELEKLVSLDAAGFLITGSESSGEFLRRIGETEKVYADFETELAEAGTVKVFDMFEVSAADRIAPELSAEAAEITEKLYAFSVKHVPGFYLTGQVGLLWGGCLIGDPEQNFAVFLLRNAFRKKNRFLNYRREELMAHELCHSVRHVLEEPALEEYFAYQTSPSPLRRYLGNCFISDKDAWGFLLPVMLLPAAEIIRALWIPDFPSWIFWLAAAVYPVFLLWRNHHYRRIVAKARKALQNAGVKQVEAVLFRILPGEMRELSFCDREKMAALVDEKAARYARWQVIKERFFKAESEQTNGENDHEN